MQMMMMMHNECLSEKLGKSQLKINRFCTIECKLPSSCSKLDELNQRHINLHSTRAMAGIAGKPK